MIQAQGGDFLVPVKGNQPTLQRQCWAQVSSQAAVDSVTLRETGHGRRMQWRVRTYQPPPLAAEWPVVRAVIMVERCGHRQGRAWQQTAVWISSLPPDAAPPLAALIRAHWHVENRLHWTKDVVFHEDASRIRTQNAPVVMSILRNIAISLFAKHGWTSITKAIRRLQHDCTTLLSWLLE